MLAKLGALETEAAPPRALPGQYAAPEQLAALRELFLLLRPLCHLVFQLARSSRLFRMHSLFSLTWSVAMLFSTKATKMFF